VKMQSTTMTARQPDGVALATAVLTKITVMATEADETRLIARMANTQKPISACFVNQHTLILALRSSHFARRLLDSDILLRDGIGVELCLAALGRSPGRNMCGTDVIPRIALAFAGRRTALFGTEEPWLSKAAAILAESGCEIVARMDGFRPGPEYVAEVCRTRPDLIILAMGSPKQETVSSMIASSIVTPAAIVNGGAIADMLAGRFERAPLWLRRARGEWLFRLLQEPKRLWRRYLLGGVVFAWYLMRLRIAS
jgi:exopolysaccharide biosynthesis WecB/TagA/CpsF family protein